MSKINKLLVFRCSKKKEQGARAFDTATTTGTSKNVVSLIHEFFDTKYIPWSLENVLGIWEALKYSYWQLTLTLRQERATRNTIDTSFGKY